MKAVQSLVQNAAWNQAQNGFFATDDQSMAGIVAALETYNTRWFLPPASQQSYPLPSSPHWAPITTTFLAISHLTLFQIQNFKIKLNRSKRLLSKHRLPVSDGL